jgi:hypothetical protein
MFKIAAIEQVFDSAINAQAIADQPVAGEAEQDIAASAPRISASTLAKRNGLASPLAADTISTGLSTTFGVAPNGTHWMIASRFPARFSCYPELFLFFYRLAFPSIATNLFKAAKLLWANMELRPNKFAQSAGASSRSASAIAAVGCTLPGA